MTVSHRPSGGVQDAGPLRFPLRDPDLSWEQERDARLAAFVRARLAHAETTGCTDERKWAAGVREVFAEWDAKRELAALADNDFFSAQVSALGWALRCVAHSTWHGAPGWEPAFHPQATAPESTSEIPS
ncbi:hypothetical protein [Streptomyces massasporeus]|uniref:hypothetical protein n=1 Tax=Streptomyces massasporeus TaxID=67324 RepID=UPI003317FAC1